MKSLIKTTAAIVISTLTTSLIFVESAKAQMPDDGCPLPQPSSCSGESNHAYVPEPGTILGLGVVATTGLIGTIAGKRKNKSN
jgi:hypothetical protein